MAKPKTNLIIKGEFESEPNLLEVWTPAPAPAKGLIEAIEGVNQVYHSTPGGCLNVWLNPCYDKEEIVAEIKAIIE